MALLQHYNYFHSGQVYSYTYSPKWLNRLTVYDKSPLLLFVNYNNIYGLVSGVNLHWLTVAQRAHLFDVMTKVFPVKDLREWGKAVNISWEFVASLGFPYRMAWRRYFPNRIRNLKAIASEWKYEELKQEVLMTNTQKIIGVTPEYIQKFYAESLARKIRAEKTRAKTDYKTVNQNLKQNIVW